MNFAHLDYRNDPTPYQDGQINVRSARAVKAGAEADVVWVQPVALTWNGGRVTNWQWDEDVWSLVGKHTIGSISGEDIIGAHVMDFSQPVVVDHYIDMLKSLRRPLLIDYGTWDLSWEPSLSNVGEHHWLKWAFGWAKVREAFPDSWVQTNKPISSHKLFLEKVGWTLTPIERARQLMHARPGSMIRWRDVHETHRMGLLWEAQITGCHIAKWWDDK